MPVLLHFVPHLHAHPNQFRYAFVIVNAHATHYGACQQGCAASTTVDLSRFGFGPIPVPCSMPCASIRHFPSLSAVPEHSTVSHSNG